MALFQAQQATDYVGGAASAGRDLASMGSPTMTWAMAKRKRDEKRSDIQLQREKEDRQFMQKSMMGAAKAFGQSKMRAEDKAERQLDRDFRTKTYEEEKAHKAKIYAGEEGERIGSALKTINTQWRRRQAGLEKEYAKYAKGHDPLLEQKAAMGIAEWADTRGFKHEPESPYNLRDAEEYSKDPSAFIQKHFAKTTNDKERISSDAGDAVYGTATQPSADQPATVAPASPETAQAEQAAQPPPPEPIATPEPAPEPAPEPSKEQFKSVLEPGVSALNEDALQGRLKKLSAVQKTLRDAIRPLNDSTTTQYQTLQSAIANNEQKEMELESLIEQRREAIAGQSADPSSTGLPGEDPPNVEVETPVKETPPKPEKPTVDWEQRMVEGGEQYEDKRKQEEERKRLDAEAALVSGEEEGEDAEEDSVATKIGSYFGLAKTSEEEVLDKIKQAKQEVAAEKKEKREQAKKAQSIARRTMREASKAEIKREKQVKAQQKQSEVWQGLQQKEAQRGGGYRSMKLQEPDAETPTKSVSEETLKPLAEQEQRASKQLGEVLVAADQGNIPKLDELLGRLPRELQQEYLETPKEKQTPENLAKFLKKHHQKIKLPGKPKDSNNENDYGSWTIATPKP